MSNNEPMSNNEDKKEKKGFFESIGSIFFKTKKGGAKAKSRKNKLKKSKKSKKTKKYGTSKKSKSKPKPKSKSKKRMVLKRSKKN